MQDPRLPRTRDVVLIGGGHSHALVLRMWAMAPLSGARLTLINPGPAAPYSGMLPGHVAGHYDRDALDIDLVRLARAAGARLVLGAVQGLDPKARLVHVDGRPPVAFDLASVNVGITSDMPQIPGFADHAVPAKPLGPFAARWADWSAQPTARQAAVIGGGVAGAELAMAMAHALTLLGREAEVTLIEAGQVLSVLGGRARARVLARMQALGVRVIETAPVARLTADGPVLQDGRRIAAQFVTGAAGARPYPWLEASGLDCTEGYLTVGPSLQTSDPAIFAAGDCAHLSHAPRPKAGVFAVRQAPVLLANLRASLTGRPLLAYHPQGDYLKLISLGGKSALAEKWGLPLAGPLMWRWKDRIDRKFMAMFRDLPAMASAPALPRDHVSDLPQALGAKPLCGGCGAKVGRGALRAALAPLPAPRRDDVTPLPGDDAALLTLGDHRQVLTTDHLRAFCEDPVVMARIAAVHALGDIWAMGAAPQAATVSLILPRLSPALQARTLNEIMATATEVIQQAGAEIVGGHTTLGDELTIGFALTGLCQGDPITLAGARAGDALILTKPLGSGVVMAAEMAGVARGADVAAAYTQMARPQGDAARILSGAHAMTDVTGFGLAGHLLGLCEASGLQAELWLDRIPLLPGALALARAGQGSSLLPENRALLPDLGAGDARADLLFDPQTGGGLLAAVSSDAADALLAQLQALGHEAARIGRLMPGRPGITLGRPD